MRMRCLFKDTEGKCQSGNHRAVCLEMILKRHEDGWDHLGKGKTGRRDFAAGSKGTLSVGAL